MTENLPVILIELALVFGGVLAFGWWQLRSVKRDRMASRRRQQAVHGETSDADGDKPLP